MAELDEESFPTEERAKTGFSTLTGNTSKLEKQNKPKLPGHHRQRSTMRSRKEPHNFGLTFTRKPTDIKVGIKNRIRGGIAVPTYMEDSSTSHRVSQSSSRLSKRTKSSFNPRPL